MNDPAASAGAPPGSPPRSRRWYRRARSGPSDPERALPTHRELRVLRKKLFHAALRVLRDEDQAEDACQETLFRTWKAVRAGKCPPHSYGSYSFGVLRNVLREVWRSRDRVGPEPGPVPEPSPDALSHLIRAESRRQVCRALDRLSPEQKEVTILTLVDDRSCASLSRSTGLPAATLRQRKHRATERLRRLLAGAR